MRNEQQQPGRPGSGSQVPEQVQQDPEQLQGDPLADDLQRDPEPGAGAAAAGSSAGEISSQGGRDPLRSVKEGYNRLRGCIDAEHCEYMDCIYFENPEQLRKVVSFLEAATNQAEREQLQPGQREQKPGAGDQERGRIENE